MPLRIPQTSMLFWLLLKKTMFGSSSTSLSLSLISLPYHQCFKYLIWWVIYCLKRLGSILIKGRIIPLLVNHQAKILFLSKLCTSKSFNINFRVNVKKQSGISMINSIKKKKICFYKIFLLMSVLILMFLLLVVLK